VGLWGEAFSQLGEAARQDESLVGFIDTAAERCLTLKFYMGIIDNPQTPECSTVPLIKSSRELAYTMATECAVLLKNDGVLPLKPKAGTRIAVIGPNGDSLYNLLGDYTAPQQADTAPTIFGAIQAAFKGCEVRYAKGCNIRTPDGELLNAAVNLARESDIVVFVLGGSSTRDFKTEFLNNGAAVSGTSVTNEMDCGEGVDLADIALHSCQAELVTAVSALKKPQVALLVQGRPYAITNIIENVNAVLCLWYPGIEGGRAAADLLLGTANPSGKLSVSIPRSTGQLPVNYNKKFAGGIAPYADCTAAPLYPFGYGLSYADFSVEKVKLEFMPGIAGLIAGQQAEVSAVIKNNSDICGKAVLAGYVFDCESSVCQREAQLKAFVKTDIPPHSEKIVKLHFGTEAFEVWGRGGNYLIERGNAVIKIGLNPDALTEIKVQLK
jgi:beta-glucosidase